MKEIEYLQNLLIEGHNRLRDVNTSFNLTRLLMNDAQCRKEAGEMVQANREYLERVEQTILIKPEYRKYAGSASGEPK